MREAHRAGLRTTATMMYGTVESDRGTPRAPAAAARPAGRDRRLHGVHHLELPARAHRARRHRGDRRRLPAHAGDRPAGARQLRQPAGLVGDPGRQGRAVEPGLRRQRHGQRDDRGERRARGRRRLLHGRARDRPQHRGRRLHRVAAQRCTTSVLGTPVFRERDVPRQLELATARAAGDTSVPGELANYPARSAAGKRQRAASAPPVAGRLIGAGHGIAARAGRLGLPRAVRRRCPTAGSW